MTNPTPYELLSRGHDKPAEGSPVLAKQRRKQATAAAMFRPDPRLEALIRLRTTDPSAFARIVDASTLMSLGHYLVAKEAANVEGNDDDAA